MRNPFSSTRVNLLVCVIILCAWQIFNHQPFLQVERASSRHENNRCLSELTQQDNTEFLAWELKGSIDESDVDAAWDTCCKKQWWTCLRVITVDGAIYFQYSDVHRNMEGNHHAMTLLLLKILSFSHFAGNALPDLDLILNIGDTCHVDRSTDAPVPVWSWAVKIAKCSDLFYPYWSFLWVPTSKMWNKQKRWEERKPKLLFRGSTTGYSVNFSLPPHESWKPGKWSMNPRALLVKKCMDIQEDCDAGFTNVMQTELQTELHPYLKEEVNHLQELNYQFQVLVDGNGPASSRALRLLHSGSALMKQESPEAEFWYPYLAPYVNYLPLARSFEDLPHRLWWAKSHHNETKFIVDAARTTANVLTDENVSCWWMSKLHRYGRLLSYPPSILNGNFTKLRLLKPEVEHLLQYMKKAGLCSDNACAAVVHANSAASLTETP